MLLQRRWTPGAATGEAVAPTGEAASKSSSVGLKKKRKKASCDTSGEEQDLKVQQPKRESTLPVSEPVQADVGKGASTPKPDWVGTSTDKLRAKRARQKRRKLFKENFGKKDPELAAEYLRSWSVREEDGPDKGKWRFNKAQQAWLIRHAYEPERVPKDVFRLLLRYVDGLRGGARDRMRTDADTIVTLRGAPLVEKEPEVLVKKKKKLSKPAEGDAPPQEEDQAEPTEAAAATTVDFAEDADDPKQRKLRLIRAKKVLGVLGESS